MIYLLYTIHIVLCLFLILVVLLQQGKGADLSVFGGGTTMTAFGARSATNLLHRLTVGAFVGFVVTTLSIAYVKGSVEGGSVMRAVEAAPATEAPAASAEPAPAVDPAAPSSVEPASAATTDSSTAPDTAPAATEPPATTEPPAAAPAEATPPPAN